MKKFIVASSLFGLAFGMGFAFQGCAGDEENAECIQGAKNLLSTANPQQTVLVKKNEQAGCRVYHTISVVDSNTQKEIPQYACCDGQESIILLF